MKKVFGFAVIVLALTSCGQINLGGSDDEITTETIMAGCKLDRPIVIDNEDLLSGLTLREAKIEPAIAGFPKDRLVVMLFEIYSNSRSTGYLGVRLEDASGTVDRGFSNDYLGALKFTGERRKLNSSIHYKTQLKTGDTVDTAVNVVIQDKAIQGIQITVPKHNGIGDKPTSETVCVTSAIR